MKREPGFYWVKLNDAWLVAYWSRLHWHLNGSTIFTDSHFEAIHETRLIPPDHKETQENADSRPE